MLFVDPLLLPDNFKTIVDDFIRTVYRLYQNNKKYDALNLFNHSKECNAVHLGYSQNKSSRTGVSMRMLNQFFGYVYGSHQHVQENLLTSVAMPMFTFKFSKDRMTDLIVSLLKKELIEFSLKQAKKHNFRISEDTMEFDYWDIKKHEWSKFKSRYLLDPDVKKSNPLLILIPKNIVNKRYEVTPERYVSYIFKGMQQDPRNQDSSGKPLTQKQLRDREINTQYGNNKDKNFILDETQRTPELFLEYLNHVEKFSDNKSLLDVELVEFLTKG